MRVTADTITDDQIRELAAINDREWGDLGVATDCALVHMGDSPVLSAEANRQIRAQARARCAEVWNARHGGEK